MERFWIGQGVKLRGRFFHPDTPRKPLDPVEPVVFTIEPPDGNEFEQTGAKVSVGVYEVNLQVEQTGDWNWRVASSGPYPGVDEETFVVKETQIVPTP